MRFLIFMLFCLISPLVGEESLPPPSQELASSSEFYSSEPEVSYQSSLIKMVLTLLGILLLFFFSVRWLRRLGSGQLAGWRSSKRIHIVEKKPLSGKSMLYLIELDGKRLLLSESQLEVRPLTVVEEEDKR